MRYKYILAAGIGNENFPERFFSIPFFANNISPTTRGADITTVTASYLPQHAQVPRLNPFVELSAPYYSNTPIKLVTDGSSQLDGIKYSVVGFGLENAETIYVYKAAGDDFSFGWLVGPPTLRYQPLLENLPCIPDIVTELYQVEGSLTVSSGQVVDIPIDVVSAVDEAEAYFYVDATASFTTSTGQAKITWLANGAPIDEVVFAKGTNALATMNVGATITLDQDRAFSARFTGEGGTVDFTYKVGVKAFIPLLRVCGQDADFVLEQSSQATITTTTDQSLTITQTTTPREAYYRNGLTGTFTPNLGRVQGRWNGIPEDTSYFVDEVAEGLRVIYNAPAVISTVGQSEISVEHELTNDATINTQSSISQILVKAA